MIQSDFWKNVAKTLASHAKYHGAQEDWEARKKAEFAAYTSHSEEVKAILAPWIKQLKRHAFVVTDEEITADGIFVRYAKRGYAGAAGFKSILDADGNLVTSWIPRGSAGERTETHGDPDEATHLGTRFNPDVLKEFLRSNVLTYIDESNLLLPAITHQKWYEDYLKRFRTEFKRLSNMKDRQAAGRQFQDFLDRLFTMASLSYRGAFRVKRREEIDGSFRLDGHTYLVEAKWVKKKIGPDALDHFQRKMQRKSSDARGVFIAVNGVTGGAAKSMREGDTPRYFIITGKEILAVIEGSILLDVLLRERQRQFDEEGEILPKTGKK